MSSTTPVITTSIVKTHSSKIDCALSIDNMAGTSSYTNYQLTCTCDGTLEKFTKFTVSSNTPNQYILTPLSLYSTLPAGQILTDTFRVKGSTSEPTDWMFIQASPTPSPPSGDVYNLDFTKMTDLSGIIGFTYQYAYDKQAGFTISHPNPDYFKILAGQGMEVNIYKGDAPFKQGDTTMPRSEMRGLANIVDNQAYVFEWTQTITSYPPTTQFSLAQVFGNGKPNVMLRFRNGTYELLCIMGGNKNLPLTNAGLPSTDVGIPVIWRLEFLLATSGGYVRAYKNNTLVGTISGNTSGGNASYIKFGLYMQEMEPVGTLTSVYANMRVSTTS